VYGAIWRVPARDGLIFSPEEKGPKLGVDYRTHPLTICGVRGYAPMRQADFGYDWQGLRGMAKEDPVRLGALADVDLLVIGHGRASALPNTTLGETFGPSMFGRPTVFSCRPLHDGAGREFPQCQLWGWAPGGVPVMLRYEDTGGAEALIRAVEAAVTAVRRDPR
jgi:hypothetical protein